MNTLYTGNGFHGLSDTTGQWFGWFGLIAALLSFAVPHVLLGLTAIVCGVIGMFSPRKTLSTAAFALGLFALVVAFT